MVNGIGSGAGGLGRSAIEAALARMHERAAELRGGPAQDVAQRPSFADAVELGVRDLDQDVKRTDQLQLEVLRGELDFHEVAAQINQSKLALDFALQVRNKLLEAYREVMRMNV